MVSLSTASKDRPGFPLIYVNTAFEVTTGYLRKDIVGRNCRFLQRGKGEPEAVKLLADALRDAQPVKVPITNFRRDGTEYSNLLAMKPIFDENGEQFQHSIYNINCGHRRVQVCDRHTIRLLVLLPPSKDFE
jgi:PAS domain S-box-containing protein